MAMKMLFGSKWQQAIAIIVVCSAGVLWAPVTCGQTGAVPTPAQDVPAPVLRVRMDDQADRAAAVEEGTRTARPAPLYKAPMAMMAVRENEDTAAILRESFQLPAFDDIPLGDILNNIKEICNVQMEIDRSARQDESLMESTLFSTKTCHWPLRQFLQRMLDEHNCTFTLDHGVIRIVSESASFEREHLLTRALSCQDILAWIAAARDSGHDVVSGTGACDEVDSDRHTPSSVYAARQLLRIVMAHLGGDEFADGTAAIDIIDGTLLVTHRYNQLCRVDEILDLLRRGRGE